MPATDNVGDASIVHSTTEQGAKPSTDNAAPANVADVNTARHLQATAARVPGYMNSDPSFEYAYKEPRFGGDVAVSRLAAQKAEDAFQKRKAIGITPCEPVSIA